MKPVSNTLHLPGVGDRFRARSGSIEIALGILLCPRKMGDCIKENCMGYKAQVEGGQHLNGAYCILTNWEPLR